MLAGGVAAEQIGLMLASDQNIVAVEVAPPFAFNCRRRRADPNIHL